ncbi:hypothetical protein NDU88_003171 [Pleurodeles waltl]|uniref:Uncharacterized protein n=1 Tax=Pleurodeles waltl TaxID=8319 RepID=A0AAV7MPT6_PLEWA|nr:hypothetical protein NDU88_003171 [Pleurodeles waltl]
MQASRTERIFLCAYSHPDFIIVADYLEGKSCVPQNPSGVPDRPHKVPDVTYKKKGTHIAASGIRYGRSLVIFPELVRILW